MQTIFITISDGEVSKNILQSDVFALLSKAVRPVLLVPQQSIEGYAKLLGESAVLEAMPKAPFPRLDEFFSDLFLYSVPTESLLVKIAHSHASGGSLIGRYIKLLFWTLGHLRLYRAICRGVYRLVPERTLDPLFDKYKPAVVFAANLTSSEDARLLKVARRHAVRSVGMPKGWDNLTLKTLLPVFPDHLLVQTELMRHDARALDYPLERSVVVGFPKFDVYQDRSKLLSRTEFLSKLGLNPDKKVVLYAGAGDQLAPYDEEILAQFLSAIETGEIAGAPQVIVRPHPKYQYRAEKIPPRPFWVLDRPGSRLGGKGDFYFGQEDVVHLMNSLYHCDLLVHTVSTLGVEAAIFDKPSVTLAYEQAGCPAALSVARYYRYDHIKRVVQTGGTQVARNFSELLRYTNAYLGDPTLDAAGRGRIAKENAGPLDGKAGERVAWEVLRYTTNG